MEDGVFPSNTMFGNFSDNNTVDFDLMDELLADGCWLETTGGSDFLQRDFSGSTFFYPAYLLPSSEISNGCMNPNLLDSNTQEDTERSIIAHDPLSIVHQTQNSVASQSIIQNPGRNFECSDQLKWYPSEWRPEPSRRLWIEPRTNEGPGSLVRDRLFKALQKMKDSIDNGDVLIQIWVPIKKGDKQILTTNDQPFSLGRSSQRLASYRSVSTDYHFSAEEDLNDVSGSTGLPGRVFSQKVPEWTPDVQYFSDQEYPRIGHARLYDVHGTVALPIFEHGSRSCLGVLEVVMTTPKIKYRNELENICKALEAVDLRSSDVSSVPHVKQAFNESHRAVLPEILEVLNAACETHKLPLAQTWVPCIQQGKGGCRHSEENYAYCVSTVDSACCVSDPEIKEFHEACSEHHLIRGQGIVGRALMTNQPCFSTDITATFTRREYPLAHYAKMFQLRGAVAIRLRSIYSGKIDYVLEFFLPIDCRDFEEQKKMLDSLSTIIQRVCRSLRVVTDKELEAEAVSQVGKEVYMPPVPVKASSQLTGLDHIMETQWKGKGVRRGKGVQKEEVSEGFKVSSDFGDSKVVLHQQQALSEFTKHDQDFMPKLNVECDGDSSLGEGSFSSVAKPAEKRRTKTEKSISLQVLRQYFAGSLKDAAKSIGVCPTTLKRICRQHGITRWPSRKIKKVGHSLRKLQVVIDSVHGAEGAFQIDSFYKNFPELTSPNLPGSNPFSTPKANDDPNSVKGFEDLPSPPAAECVSSPIAATSKSPSSSCSQSSNSSLYFSNGKQQNPVTAHLAGSENATMVNILKRARSDAELCASVQEELGLLARSQSHKSLRERPTLDSLPALPKGSSRSTRDKAAVRVKVMYGEEKVRFSMQSYWRFVDLQQEIAKRFNIDDMSRIDLKYLDDDTEWVLLTCDADVEECIDIYRSSHARTVKLSVHQVSPSRLGGAFCSCGPS